MATVVSIINEKGGVGKSTLISYLSVLAHDDGLTVALIETDPSNSQAKWHKSRVNSAGKAAPVLLVANEDDLHTDPETGLVTVVRSAADKLAEAVERARAAGADWIFVDTGAGKQSIQRAAAKVSDVVLIPTTPSPRDQAVTGITAQMVNEEGKPSFLVMNKGSQSKAANDKEAVKLSALFRMPALPTHLTMRIPIQKADLIGETLFDLDSQESSVTAGRAEFRALWNWLREYGNGRSAKTTGAA